jgi:hypothetical protein
MRQFSNQFTGLNLGGITGQNNWAIAALPLGEGANHPNHPQSKVRDHNRCQNDQRQPQPTAILRARLQDLQWFQIRSLG